MLPPPLCHQSLIPLLLLHSLSHLLLLLQSHHLLLLHPWIQLRLPRAHRSTPSVPSPRSPVRPRYAEAKRSVPRSRSPPRRRPRSPSRRRTRSHRSRPRHTKPRSPSIVRSPLDTRTSGNSSPPRTAFSDRRRPQRRRQA
eukprot:s2552_g9.t1